MSTHYVILSALSASPKEVAQVDVATESAVGVQWTVFFNGAPTQSNVILAADPTYFAPSTSSSIPNLFTPSGTQLSLVRVQTIDGGGQPANVLSRATFKQKSGTTKVIANLPWDFDAQGNPQSVGPNITFSQPELQQGSTLFVAAIGGPADFTLQYGGAAPSAPYHLDGFNVMAISLTTANTRVKLRTQSAGQNIFAMLGIDTGKVDETVLLADY